MTARRSIIAAMIVVVLAIGAAIAVTLHQRADDAAANRACAPVCVQWLGGVCIKTDYWYRNTPYPCNAY